jgi:hypothetical protein
MKFGYIMASGFRSPRSEVFRKDNAASNWLRLSPLRNEILLNITRCPFYRVPEYRSNIACKFNRRDIL